MDKKTTPHSIVRSRDEKIERLKEKVRAEQGVDELSVENRYFRSLLEITRSINKLQGFEELLELIVDSAVILTKAERGFLMLARKDGGLEFKVTRNMDKKALEDEEFRISRTVANQVLATGESLFSGDIYKDKKLKISESIETLGLRMVMCVPLKAKGNILGLIYVDSRSETETFTKLGEKMFEAFAAQASVAIENSYLYDSSVHDRLTGLYNYGYFRIRLEEEIIRALGYKKGTVSFIMLDLDDFKSINDSYGHLIGNSILVKIAGLIKDRVRKYDIPARYGGDEFAILMPDADMQDAQFLAQRLQKALGDLRFSVGKETLSVTSSIGISTFPVEKIADSENIIVEAEHALFVAKNKGGNQIAVIGLREDEKKNEPEFIGMSKLLVEVRTMIAKLAQTDATILIIGETGTGKELVANLIHNESARKNMPLIIVNCGAIPDNLLESELFGYEKGAFTGAYRQHKGKFELAHGGTILLDEIGDLPIHLQVKILRAIEQKQIDRIGGKSPIAVDARIIAASNRNLEEAVKNNNFRKDLYYRLTVATIQLPTLKERPEDILAIGEHYLSQMNKRYQKKFTGFTRGAVETMMQHPWPGNVRELIHRIERAVIIGSGQYLDENALGLVAGDFVKLKPLRELRNKTEKEGIIQALICNRWNITHTSKVLRISRKTLKYLMHKHHISKPDKK